MRAADDDVKAVSCCHPAFFGKEKEYAAAAVHPVAILPAGGDPMEDAREILSAKPFADKCLFRRFDDQVHGWMAARGEWEKPQVAAAAGQAVELLVEFYKANVCA